MEKNSTDTRARNFCFVVAEESAPENWIKTLDDEHVPAFISPLHCDDKTADGKAKFHHWHIIVMFRGKKSVKQVRELAHKVGAVNDYVQICKDLRGYARYLCHLDDPNKAQYNPADVISLGGADYISTIGTSEDTDTALSEIMDFCVENGCDSFYRLAIYARNNRPDWFRVLTSKRTVFLTAWLKSMSWEAKQGRNID